MRVRIAIIVGCAVSAAPVAAQVPLTRSDAVEAAVARGGRLGLAQADTAVAGAALLAARARPNPALDLSYSRSVPTYHVSVDVPVDYPRLRRLRIQSAQASVRAADLRYTFARASIAMEADTTYTRAIAARERLALSRRTALDADRLLHMVERRRDAGDASDMDVELARVNAGEQANVAASDSLTYVSSVLDLQALLGDTTGTLAVVPSDSITMPPPPPARRATTVNEAAAALSLEAADLATRLQRRSRWSQLSFSLGAETGDPDQRGILPTVGVGIGLPLLDRNRGGIALAEAEQLRAGAELTLARIEARSAVAHAERERANALSRVERDRVLVTSADRVAAMSLTAYREGASSLPNVLEAQRSAREILAQYVDDLAAAWIATAELRVSSLTPISPNP
jgi:cobalt-zinc-cadmium efflux system outer membrane protein